MSKFGKEFKEFALKGNVMDMAVGVIIGGAFGKIISSLVDDIIMPLVGRLVGNVDFTNLYVALSGQGSDLPFNNLGATGIVLCLNGIINLASIIALSNCINGRDLVKTTKFLVCCVFATNCVGTLSYVKNWID